MTPKEFVDKYPIGTRFKIGKNPFMPHGWYTYTGTEYCSARSSGCRHKCRGHILTLESDQNCFVNHSKNMPLEGEPVMPTESVVGDDLNKELFEI